MRERVTMRTAARELGLRRRELDVAVQLGRVPTVRGPAGEGRLVPRSGLERLREEEAVRRLREDVRVVHAGQASELLGIGPARFARLARAGCVRPVTFFVNRYRTVVWLYLPADLRTLAEERPELLTGTAPAALRARIAGGADRRPLAWRCRRIDELLEQADGPWERAAALAAVVGRAEDEGGRVLDQLVSDPAERVRLTALQPELSPVRAASPVTRELVEELGVCTDPDEVLWFRSMLESELSVARTAGSGPAGGGEARPVGEADPGGGGAGSGAASGPAGDRLSRTVRDAAPEAAGGWRRRLKWPRRRTRTAGKGGTPVTHPAS